MFLFILIVPVIAFFIFNAIVHLYYALKLNKKYPEEHDIRNSCFTCILWVISGFLYPFYFPLDDSDFYIFGILSFIFICVVTPFIIFLILFYQYLFVFKKKPEISEIRTIDNLLREFHSRKRKDDNFKNLPLKVDFKRKVLHLFPASVIIFIWVFSVYIWEGIWKANIVWGISGLKFADFLIITAGFSGIFVFAALDYVRLSYIFENHNLFFLIPSNVMILLSKSMKKRELYEFTKPVAMVLALAPLYFLDFSIFVSAALIATVGDAAASLMGLKFGKYHFPKNSQKTVVGYLSGFCTAFFTALVSLIIFSHSLNGLKVFFLSFIGAIVFLLIDILNLKIDDNILNPLLCGGVMGIFFYLI
ncbi:MAG: hypothetical protein EU548_08470 [Promethearchaeota archaeon]|nr:MAG: hypothetical protein EU548_08470 [Candidatus Lokiarchaeota archaeon]